MSWLGKVVLAVILAYGWILANLLREKNKIDEDIRLTVLAELGLLFLVQQIFLARPKPYDRSAIERQRKLAENCLTSLLESYYETLGEPQKGLPRSVRANLALPTRNWRSYWRSYLKIYYSICPDGCAYSAEELALKWPKGTGAIGSAWKTKDITLFDSEDRRFRGPADAVSDRQKEVASRIKSLLAVPIIGEGRKVLGVLTLDSTDGIETTKLCEPQVLKVTQAYADTIRPLCFSNGVS
jgi:hypothetical protein